MICCILLKRISIPLGICSNFGFASFEESCVTRHRRRLGCRRRLRTTALPSPAFSTEVLPPSTASSFQDAAATASGSGAPSSMDLGLCFNQLPGFEAKPDVTQMTMREPKPYKCPHCVKSFANNSYLSQHMRIHLGIKPFGPCQYCGKKFTQLSHLQQHIRTHTGEKPYKCKIPNCDKAFSQLSNLQSHSRCHQSDKPFKCNSCYKCFNDEAALLEHIPKHKESKHLKVHICSFCGKSYTQSLYLDKHMTKHADRRTDFRTQNKAYYSSDLTPEAFDSLQSFNSLPGFPSIMQFQRDAANASASSMSGVAGASPSPYSYPTTTNAAAVTTSLINNFSTSALSSQLLLQQQFNRQQANSGRLNGATNGNTNGTSASNAGGSGGFNMITPLEKINSFNQNGVTSNGSESNGLQNAAGGFQLS
uniref:Zinc finger protein rotund n=1 Tax=Panagrellus redivivus TaxID=6233 RepID=A0A7E4VD71_PANRE